MFQQIVQTGDIEILSFVHDMMIEVKWQDHSQIPISDYRRLRNLVCLDRYFGYTEEEIADRQDCEVKDLEPRRRSRWYQELDQAISEAFKTASEVLDFRDHVADVRTQDRAARKVKRMVESSDERVGERALGQLTERMVPPARPAETSRVLILDEAGLKLLLESEKMMDVEPLSGAKRIGDGSSSTVL